MVSPRPSDVRQSADQIFQFAEVNVRDISSLKFSIMVDGVIAVQKENQVLF